MILQADSFDTDSLTICPFTTDPTDAPLFRIEIGPAPGNGLHEPCRLMVDKVSTVARSKLGERIGVLDPGDLVRVNRAVVLFLGIAATG